MSSGFNTQYNVWVQTGVSFLATIDDISEYYVIQMGRDGSDFTFSTSVDNVAIDDVTPPMMVCVIEYKG